MLVTASAEREAGYWMLDTGGGKKAMIAVAGNPKSKIQKPKSKTSPPLSISLHHGRRFSYYNRN
jgi:hypothetical protein